jgi:hypothetical protein
MDVSEIVRYCTVIDDVRTLYQRKYHEIENVASELAR